MPNKRGRPPKYTEKQKREIEEEGIKQDYEERLQKEILDSPYACPICHKQIRR